MFAGSDRSDEPFETLNVHFVLVLVFVFIPQPPSSAAVMVRELFSAALLTIKA